MPKQINSKMYPRRAVNAYHKKILELIALVRHWPKDSKELHDFLDRDTLSLPEPMEYTDFRKKFKEVRDAGVELGLYENQIGEMKAKILAERLYYSGRRSEYYARILNEKCRLSPVEKVEPFSLIELEQRYQHYLYKKARKIRFLGIGPRFEVWCTTENCVTFYDD